MISVSTFITVRYAEADAMNYVYYGNYPTYLEVGRTALLKSIGMSYRELEDRGVLLPVKDLKIDYVRAAKYDDTIEVCTTLHELPTAKIIFHYRLLRGEELLATAETTLVFVDAVHRKPMRCPDDLLNLIKENWKSV